MRWIESCEDKELVRTSFLKISHDGASFIFLGHKIIGWMTKQLEGYERYRQFMDRLTESNVDDYIDLPMIAVMGDTSSGKSSLLSNISLVDLPSADCLTTRCPIMLKMHNATIRSACVKVSWKEKEGAEFAERKIVEENWHSITGAIADAQGHIIKISGKEVSRALSV